MEHSPLLTSMQHMPALGNIALGLPLLGWGLLAVSIPVIVHLVFRERAQLEIFPAMRFLIQSHVSATRAHWLRHMLLLLARIAVIVLAVSVLGRLGCTREGDAAWVPAVDSASPASVVFCIDNSAGMGYRYQGQTRVQSAVDWARTLMHDTRRFGPGSQFALVSGTPSPGLGTWRDDPRAAARLLDTIRPAGHNLSAAHLLGRAYHLLSAARHPRQEIYLFNDLTESSWTENPPPTPPSLTGLYIMDSGQAENRNLALSWPQLPPHELPVGAPLSIPIRIISGDLPSEPLLQFELDGQPRGRQSAGPLAPNSQTEIVLHLPALEPGPHSLEISLEPGDALACDNSRYAWLFAGALPRVGLISSGTDNDVSRMIQAMIAPPQLPPAEQRYVVQPIPIDSLLDRHTDELIAIFLADIKGLNGLAWEKLATYVQAGGTLVIIPGPSLSPQDYQAAGAILPASIEGVAICDPPVRPAVSDLSHPYLLPFADLTIDSVNDRHAFKRLSCGPLSTRASVVFPFSDGTPALLQRPIGKGRAILFAFSPASDWGQFGTQAAPTIVLLHRILETVRPSLRNLASVTAGLPSNRPVGDGSSPLLVRSEAGSERILMPSPNRLYSLPAEPPQLYTAAEKSTPQQVALHYSVNVAESESRLVRIDGDNVKSRFDNALTRVVRPGDELQNGTGAGLVRVNWGVPLGVGLILLLIAESSFSNRFYRSRCR